MKIRNNNPTFGDSGPFEAETFEALAAEMQPNFRLWADEQEAVGVENGIPYEQLERGRDERVAKMRREFIAGLEEV